MSDLEELAKRCEEALGPDRELDARIWCVVGIGSPWTAENCMLAATVRPPEIKASGITLEQALDRWPADAAEWAKGYNVPRYTASFDAAMMLVPEGAHCGMGADATGSLKGWAWVRLKVGDTWEECHSPRRDRFTYIDPMPQSLPLAITAAALRARSSCQSHRTEQSGEVM